MRVKLEQHNDDVQLNYGHHGFADTKKHLEVGKEYEAVVVQHDWHTDVCIDGNKYNSVCFEFFGNEADEPPLKLKAIIADTPNVFICRIGTDPETTRTGLANIIPQGIDRDSKDEAIRFTNRLVERYNNYKD